ncbi:MAG: protein phosphatase 2C domain-containing protein [Gemmatimonadota bacterium]
MTLADLLTTSVPAIPGVKPRDDELDLFGLTHPGKVRRENQDHFLLCTVHPQVVMHGTSLPNPDQLPLRGERLATILLVADGVGSGTGGGAASKIAAETITGYLSSSLRCYHAAGAADRAEFPDALRAAALEAHATVRAAAVEQQVQKMATTLTLAIAVWPWMHVVQVGDSRCYFYSGGKLRQVTRDQTMAQDLVDQGVLPAERISLSPFNNVLASAIGADEAMPVVTRLGIAKAGSVILLCSDGLTKHVSDEMIAGEISRMDSSEQLCRRLLDLALDGGGSDNVTVLAARAVRQAQDG